MTDTNGKVERPLVKIELSKYPSDEPICGFVVEDHIADAATTLLMAIFADRCKPAEKEISEIEFLREKIKELEEKINSPSIRPSPIVICPCPKREEYPNQYQPAPLLPEPYYYDTGRFTCGTFTGGHP